MRLYAHTEKRFSETETEIERLRSELTAKADLVYNLLDSDIKRRETDEQERLIIGHQLTRHEQWFDQLAVKTKTKLLPGRL